jgi:integrase/recombinase XerD
MFEALAPSLDSKWMLPAIGKLKTKVTTSKNHSDLPSIKELFEVGLSLMGHVEAGKAGTVKQCAVMYRNGLAIAMLAARPFMRRQNLAMMRIGQNIVEDRPIYRLQFTGDDMKGRGGRGGPLPTALTASIDRYLTVHRPVLLIGKPDIDGTFFISGMGLPIYPHALSHEIGKITEAFLGRRICTHEFRHATGSSIAKEDPEHVGIVPNVLGHSDYRTSEGYYIFADEHAAFVRLDKALEKLARMLISTEN